MITALLLAAATVASPPAQNAIDAERAFAADAQKLGQWTAFKKWSAPDALMFVPQPIKAHVFLKDRKDPPVAVFWWPGRSYVSCDRSLAINTGPWVREWGKSVGYFTTVWARQGDGSWKWVYDAGDDLSAARAEGGDIKPVTAACAGNPATVPPPLTMSPAGATSGSGSSPDRSLQWRWTVLTDGSREFVVNLWDGQRMNEVLADRTGKLK